MTHFNAQKLKESIRAGVEAGAGTGDLHAIVVAFAQAGGSKSDAERVLGELVFAWRASNSEEEEDQVLDLLDLVTGWCSPQYRIWPE